MILDSALSDTLAAEEHIRSILETLRPCAAALQELDAEREIYLGYSSANGQGGMVLSVELMGELARHGLDLVLDLYPPSEFE